MGRRVSIGRHGKTDVEDCIEMCIRRCASGSLWGSVAVPQPPFCRPPALVFSVTATSTRRNGQLTGFCRPSAAGRHSAVTA